MSFAATDVRRSECQDCPLRLLLAASLHHVDSKMLIAAHSLTRSITALDYAPTGRRGWLPWITRLCPSMIILSRFPFRLVTCALPKLK